MIQSKGKTTQDLGVGGGKSRFLEQKIMKIFIVFLPLEADLVRLYLAKIFVHSLRKKP